MTTWSSFSGVRLSTFQPFRVVWFATFLRSQACRWRKNIKSSQVSASG